MQTVHEDAGLRQEESAGSGEVVKRMDADVTQSDLARLPGHFAELLAGEVDRVRVFFGGYSIEAVAVGFDRERDELILSGLDRRVVRLRRSAILATEVQRP